MYKTLKVFVDAGDRKKALSEHYYFRWNQLHSSFIQTKVIKMTFKTRLLKLCIRILFDNEFISFVYGDTLLAHLAY